MQLLTDFELSNFSNWLTEVNKNSVQKNSAVITDLQFTIYCNFEINNRNIKFKIFHNVSDNLDFDKPEIYLSNLQNVIRRNLTTNFPEIKEAVIQVKVVPYFNYVSLTSKEQKKIILNVSYFAEKILSF